MGGMLGKECGAGGKVSDPPDPLPSLLAEAQIL